LPIPPIACQDPRAIELIRVWAAGGKQHLSLSTGLWKDPAACGIMLVDLAKLLSNAYAQGGGFTREQALQRICEGFDAEWRTSTTDGPIGNFVG
jgi:Domain of unknown function (DUF5076)